MKSGIHIPGLPKTPEPSNLAQMASAIHHPDAIRTGITTTTDGKWALLVIVKQATQLPIKAIEEHCKGYPVIYQYEPEKLPVARPAYPSLGE